MNNADTPRNLDLLDTSTESGGCGCGGCGCGSTDAAAPDTTIEESQVIADRPHRALR